MMYSNYNQAPQYYPMQNNNIQTSGFISVPNENVVYNYPVAPGSCVTFKIEGQPVVLEKSMGFSQLDSPKIERYKLIKETPASPSKEKSDTEILALWNEINNIKDVLEVLKHEQSSNNVSATTTKPTTDVDSEVQHSSKSK